MESLIVDWASNHLTLVLNVPVPVVLAASLRRPCPGMGLYRRQLLANDLCKAMCSLDWAYQAALVDQVVAASTKERRQMTGPWAIQFGIETDPLENAT